ncbi:MAG: bifunctional methylenetetrahydrofolate dehydrogenase/methenyltetrahydrofolate cyclohydrolase FolD [bacterium]|nr:bifunctional methylenetetrahydrofolate dehydrogenase/methenyltetrahydrofolate cyclohydrolase FolD [bacterium]
MSAQVLDGKAVARAVLAETAERVAALSDRGKETTLATVLVGEDPASAAYVRSKRRRAAEVGIRSVHHELAGDASQDRVVDLLRRLNEDPSVDGILLQLPLPAGLNDQSATIEIDPAKDVDGLHPTNLGMIVLDRPVFAPCTPSGCLRILEHYDVPLRGANVVVVGRSFLVGRPLALLLAARGVDATVTIAHSRTEDLPGVTRRADILVVAVGRPEMVTGRYVREGAVVIDVGINRTASGSLVGDVKYEEVAEVAAAITPVPGGVGPMTVAMLMHNTAVASGMRARP